MCIDAHDTCEQRCRMLGHAVPFSYCRQLPEGQPCRLIVDCWQGRFDVVAFLQKHYSPEQIKAILAPPKPKMTSIIEMIEQAKKAGQSPQE